jgi:hypothetical protein
MKDLCVLQSLIIDDGRADGNRERLFNPGLVYDYIGEIFSVLVIASYVATILLYFFFFLTVPQLHQPHHVVIITYVQVCMCVYRVIWRHLLKIGDHQETSLVTFSG